VTPLEQLDLANLRILDGAMATELEQRGCDISGPLWSAAIIADSPATIAAVHADYLSAGADCLLTASYQVSAAGYAEIGMPPQHADQALRRSVQLAQAAREQFAARSSRRIWIAASLGPYGAALHNGAEYHGNYNCSFEDLVGFHARRLEVLNSTNADLVAFETVPSFSEAEAIVAALHQFPEIGAWISFTCQSGHLTAHGEQIASCGALLQAERQVVAVGINCTAPRWVTTLISELRRTTTKPIVVYPNSGEQWDAEHRRWLGTSDSVEFGHWAREWFDAGAQAVGGCCRTGPKHIEAIRAVFGPDRYRP
jgi:homocysteine S-methyltransferase